MQFSESVQLDKRLRAARYFVRHGTREDETVLRKWLSRESVGWIRGALQQALQRYGTEAPADDEREGSLEVSDAGREIYAQAIEDTAASLVHEIEPILGLARLYGQREIQKFESSQVGRQLDRLESLLKAMDTLSRVAGVAKFEELDLAELVRRIAEAEGEGHTVRLEFAGPDPAVVVGDKALLEVLVSNGLRNAIEASEESGKANGRVVVTWGETDRDYWVVILDEGPGLPGAVSRLFEIGSTTKEGHHGMGLALGRRAMLSMGGAVTLRSRREGGAVLECRWPKSVPL